MKLKDVKAEQEQASKEGIREYVTVEDTSANLKTLKIKVPPHVVMTQFNAAMSTVARQATIPGFRRGRVPARLIEKQFGDAIRHETRMTLVQNMVSDAIEIFEIKALGEPRVKDIESVVVERDKPVEFEVEVEVLPDFDLPEYASLEILRPSLEMPEGIIDEEIQKLCVNEGSLEERESPEPGDYLTGRGVMVDQHGTEFYNIDGAVVRIPEESDEGKGMILGVAVDDFSKQLGMPKSDETVTIKIKGPENHEVEEIREKDLTVTFEVQRVDRIIPAEMADVVAKMGMAGEGQLREIIEQRLEENAKMQQQSAMQTQVAQYMLDNTEFELPEKLTANQAERNLERQRMELIYKGVDPQEIEENLAEMRSASAKAAVRELKLLCILGKVSDELDITITAKDVNEHIGAMAARHGVTPDAMREQITKADKLGSIRAQVREHLTMNAILDKVNVKDVTADEYNEYVRGLNEAH